MRKTETREIGGVVYHVGQLAPEPALQLLERVSKVVAEPLSDALSGGADAESVEALGKALKGLLKNATAKDVLAIARELASVTDVEVEGGKRPRLSTVFDVHFHGKLADLFKFVAFGLEVQFADFLASLRDALNKARAAIDSKAS